MKKCFKLIFSLFDYWILLVYQLERLPYNTIGNQNEECINYYIQIQYVQLETEKGQNQYIIWYYNIMSTLNELYTLT